MSAHQVDLEGNPIDEEIAAAVRHFQKYGSIIVKIRAAKNPDFYRPDGSEVEIA